MHPVARCGAGIFLSVLMLLHVRAAGCFWVAVYTANTGQCTELVSGNWFIDQQSEHGSQAQSEKGKWSWPEANHQPPDFLNCPRQHGRPDTTVRMPCSAAALRRSNQPLFL